MNDDLWKAIEADGQADADAFENLTTEGATELASMVRHLISLQSELVEAEQKVKDVKSKVMRYTHDRIPAKMQETGLDEAKVGGNKISLATYVNGTMPKDPLQRDIALAHLRNIGASDLIKNQMSVGFAVKEDNKARAVAEDLRKAGHDPVLKTWVEPSTLKKLIRERTEKGQEIDLELFNASMGMYAKVKGDK